MYLYIIISANGLFKIGKTTNLKARVAQIKTSSPVPCSLLFHTQYDEKVIDLEKKYHAEFNNKRVRGEWFNLSKSDLLPIIGDNKEAYNVLDNMEIFGKFAFYAAMDSLHPPTQ